MFQTIRDVNAHHLRVGQWLVCDEILHHTLCSKSGVPSSVQSTMVRRRETALSEPRLLRSTPSTESRLANVVDSGESVGRYLGIPCRITCQKERPEKSPYFPLLGARRRVLNAE